MHTLLLTVDETHARKHRRKDSWDDFMALTPKAQTNKKKKKPKLKIDKWDDSKLNSFCKKGNNRQSEKATRRMGENVCKAYV